jgi:hypothetical protein
MDCWHPIIVRAERPSALQRWAQLEAKSPTMREELAQRYSSQNPTRRRSLSNAAIYVELIAVALKAWCHIYSG